MSDTTDGSELGKAAFDEHVLLLDPQDNVVIARNDLLAGTTLVIDGHSVELRGNAPTGFKIARNAIREGEKILKYGAHIGSATVDIQAGEAIHVNNMKSDYLPTYTLEEGNTFSEGELE